MSYIVVTGFPGAGKSSVARPLAAALCLPLIAKDTVKEALAAIEDVDQIDEARSRHLGAAAFEVVFAVAANAFSVVLEASWDPSKARPRLAGLPGEVIEVHCVCPPEVARSRYIDRADVRHRVHRDADRFDDHDLWSPARGTAAGLSDPVIDVDCTRPLDVASLAEAVKAHPGWRACPSGCH